MNQEKRLNEQNPQSGKRPPGTCTPWEVKRGELPDIQGDEELVKRIWEETDALAYLFIWHCLLSF